MGKDSSQMMFNTGGTNSSGIVAEQMLPGAATADLNEGATPKSSTSGG